MKPSSAFLKVRNQRTLFGLLTWAVLAILIAQSQTAFAYQEQKEQPSTKLNRGRVVLPQTAFTYQGQLKDSGLPANGTYELQFTLFTAQTAGYQLGSIVKDSIAVTNGSFSVGLDFGNTFLDGAESWLEIAIRPAGSTDTFTVLTPRQRLTPTPYAILAQAEPWSLIGVPVGFERGVDSDVVTVDKLADNAVTSAKIADGQVVKSFNSLKDDVKLAAGENVTITPNGNTLTIAAQSGTGWVNDKGVVRLTTDANNVGIGITEPTAKLDVAGIIRARDAVRVGNSILTWANHIIEAVPDGPPQPYDKQIRIGFSPTATNNPTLANFSQIQVGIGTLNPLNTLHVKGQVRIEGLTSNPFNDVIVADPTGVLFTRPASTLGGGGNPWLLTGNPTATAASFLGPTTPTVPLVFKTGTGAGGTERMRIVDPSGNVGIGTPAPASRLHVSSSAVNTIAKIESTAPQNGGAFVLFDAKDSSSINHEASISFGQAGPAQTNSAIASLEIDSANLPLILRSNNNNAIYVKTDGNVGIGTTSPVAAKFVVNAGTADAIQLQSTSNHSWRLGPNTGNGADFGIHDDTAAQTRLKIDFNGNVGIGTPTPAVSFKLDVAGAAHATSFPTSSDARLKTNITPLTNVVEKLQHIRGIAFDWNDVYQSLGRSTGHREIGVIAQEVEAVFPELVTVWGNEGYRAVDYSRMTAVLIEAVKELKAENDALKQRIERLEKTTAKR